MSDPAGMVCTSGRYKRHQIEVCVDQAEYTNRRRDQAVADNADTIFIFSVGEAGEPLRSVGFEKSVSMALAKLARRPVLGGDVARYVLGPMSVMVFPRSPVRFDDPDQPLVDVRGRAFPLPYDKIMLGAQELCGLETVEINGKLYRKRLLTPDEWTAVASDFGTKAHSTRTGKLDEAVLLADGTRAVGRAIGHYVEHGGREVYDMDANVWEWTYDPTADAFYVSGASWYFSLSSFSVDHGWHESYTGLRCGMSPQDAPITPQQTVK